MRLKPWIDKSKVDFEWLSDNPNAVSLLEEPDNWFDINWNMLSGNPNAFHLLNTFPDKINWFYLSGNTSYDVVQHILEKNIEKIDWSRLSSNIPLFSERNFHTILSWFFSRI